MPDRAELSKIVDYLKSIEDIDYVLGEIKRLLTEGEL